MDNVFAICLQVSFLIRSMDLVDLYSLEQVGGYFCKLAVFCMDPPPRQIFDTLDQKYLNKAGKSPQIEFRNFRLLEIAIQICVNLGAGLKIYRQVRIWDDGKPKKKKIFLVAPGSRIRMSSHC